MKKLFLAAVICITTLLLVTISWQQNFAQGITPNVVQNLTHPNLTMFKILANNTDSKNYNESGTLPYWIFMKEQGNMNKSSGNITKSLANTLNFTSNHDSFFVLKKIPVRGVPNNWKPYPHPHPHPIWIHHKPHALGGTSPQGQLSGDTPQEIWNAYGLPPASCSMTGYPWGDSHLCGYGEVVAVVDAYDNSYIQSDLAAFDTQFGLPSCTSTNHCFSKFSYSGTPTTPPSSDTVWESEIDLDVEWVHAMAPGAAIALVETTSPSSDLFSAAQDIATEVHGVNQVSMSWGGAEYSSETSTDAGFQVPGVSFIGAIGDNGDVPPNSGFYPAMSPYVVAVGGTVLSFNNGNFQNEIAWSLNYGGSPDGTGGGLSQYESEPTYQHNFGISSNKRGTPDVSASAWNIPIFDSYDTLGTGCTTDPSNCWATALGTSGAAPKWAGIIAIANSQHPSTPLSSTSFGTLDAIYQAAVGNSYASNYRDITSGSNGNCSICTAGQGYDFVTGLGSPNVQNLISFLTVYKPTSTTTSSSLNPSVFGQSVNFTASVLTNSGTPTGNVTFAIDGVAQRTVALSGTHATFSSSTIPAGTHSITSTYSGNANFTTSISTLVQTVKKASTTTTLVSNSSSTISGQSVNFTSNVSVVSPGVGTPTGNVTFAIDGVAQRTVALSGTHATFSSSIIPAGTHSITATYSGNANFTTSTSSALVQTVNLATPTGVLASTLSANSIGISWSVSPGAQFYIVYRSNLPSGPFGTSVATQYGTTFTDTGVAPGMQYYYKVKAVYAGISSTLSSVGTATTSPAAPTGIIATALNSTSIKISWTASHSATSYDVFRSTNSSGPFITPVGTSTIQSYADTGLSANAKYYYKITAANTGGTSTLSSIVPSTTLLSAPTGVSATSTSPHSIHLSWTGPVGSTSYQIFRALFDTSTSKHVLATTASTSFDDTGLSTGVQYYYKIMALNSANTSDMSSVVSATPH